MKRLIRKALERRLPAGYDIDTHFKPTLQPVGPAPVPGAGRRSVRGDRRRPRVGRHRPDRHVHRDRPPARVRRRARGRPDRHRDGARTCCRSAAWRSPSTATTSSCAKTLGYKGMMLSGVPNLAFAVGYTNASWTLKCDLTCEYVCRLLNHMDEHGYRECTPAEPRPVGRPRSRSSTSRPATCCARSTSSPGRARRPPWRLYQNYARDILMLRFAAIEDDAMEFSNGGPVGRPGGPITGGFAHVKPSR